MSRISIATQLFAAVLLSGCATSPMGPTALVMPASGKPFDVFVQEQAMCKQFAGGEVEGGATMSNLKQLGTMVVSTALGGGLGAAVRGRRGAEIGGAVGAIGGSAMAGHGSARDQNSLQGRYDMAYTQCMYSRGNQIASAARPAPQVAYGSPGTSSFGYQGNPGYPPSPPGYYPQAPGMIR
jgi:hypothetical protein